MFGGSEHRMKRLQHASYVTDPSLVPLDRSDYTTHITNHKIQANTTFENQEGVGPSTNLDDMEMRTKAEASRTDWAVLDPSRHVTISAETKARWELLRALAGVKKSEHPQSPKLEADVKNPTQIIGPHPYEIVAAQVLPTSTAPPLSEPSYGSAAVGIGRRNASRRSPSAEW
jgi:hypothetical protein